MHARQFIQISPDLADSEEVATLECELGIDNDAAMLTAIKFWSWIFKHHQEGRFADNRANRLQLRRACAWPGQPDHLVNALLAADLLRQEGDDLAVTGWEEQYGQLLAKRRYQAEWVARKRQAVKESTSNECRYDVDSTGDCRGNVDSTVDSMSESTRAEEGESEDVSNQCRFDSRFDVDAKNRIEENRIDENRIDTSSSNNSSIEITAAAIITDQVNNAPAHAIVLPLNHDAASQAREILAALGVEDEDGRLVREAMALVQELPGKGLVEDAASFATRARAEGQRRFFIWAGACRKHPERLPARVARAEVAASGDAVWDAVCRRMALLMDAAEFDDVVRRLTPRGLVAVGESERFVLDAPDDWTAGRAGIYWGDDLDDEVSRVLGRQIRAEVRYQERAVV